MSDRPVKMGFLVNDLQQTENILILYSVQQSRGLKLNLMLKPFFTRKLKWESISLLAIKAPSQILQHTKIETMHLYKRMKIHNNSYFVASDL